LASGLRENHCTNRLELTVEGEVAFAFALAAAPLLAEPGTTFLPDSATPARAFLPVPNTSSIELPAACPSRRGEPGAARLRCASSSELMGASRTVWWTIWLRARSRLPLNLSNRSATGSARR